MTGESAKYARTFASTPSFVWMTGVVDANAAVVLACNSVVEAVAPALPGVLEADERVLVAV